VFYIKNNKFIMIHHLTDHIWETTRPDEVDSDLNRIFKTIDAGKLEEARRQITNLMHKIGADPELVKAEVLIKRRELIGK
jgi:hypothetical protein